MGVDWRFGETAEFEAEQFGWSPEFLDEASLRQDFASIAAEAAAVAAERLRRPDLVVQVATNDPQQQQPPVNRGPHPIFDQPTQRPANQHVAVATEARMGTRQGLDMNNNEINCSCQLMFLELKNCFEMMCFLMNYEFAFCTNDNKCII